MLIYSIFCLCQVDILAAAAVNFFSVSRSRGFCLHVSHRSYHSCSDYKKTNCPELQKSDVEYIRSIEIRTTFWPIPLYGTPSNFQRFFLFVYSLNIMWIWICNLYFICLLMDQENYLPKSMAISFDKKQHKRNHEKNFSFPFGWVHYYKFPPFNWYVMLCVSLLYKWLSEYKCVAAAPISSYQITWLEQLCKILFCYVFISLYS